MKFVICSGEQPGEDKDHQHRSEGVYPLWEQGRIAALFHFWSIKGTVALAGLLTIFIWDNIHFFILVKKFGLILVHSNITPSSSLGRLSYLAEWKERILIYYPGKDLKNSLRCCPCTEISRSGPNQEYAIMRNLSWEHNANSRSTFSQIFF